MLLGLNTVVTLFSLKLQLLCIEYKVSRTTLAFFSDIKRVLLFTILDIWLYTSAFWPKIWIFLNIERRAARADVA